MSGRLPVAPHRIVHGVLTVAFALVVVAFAIHSLPGIVGAEASYIVLSGSMEPAISPGDVVVVYETDPATIEAGDIITFARGSNPIPVTHRVVAVDTTGGTPMFETAGDNNEGPDPAPVSGDQVIGIVPGVDVPVLGTILFVIPFIGYVVKFVKTPIGLAVFVVAPIALLFALEGWGALRERRAQKKRAETRQPTETTAAVARLGSTSTATTVATSDNRDDTAERAAGSSMAVSVSDLRYTAVVLGVFTTYGALTAVLLEEVWAVSIAVALGGFTLMAVGVQRGWFAAPETDRTANAVDGDPPGFVHIEDLPIAVMTAPRTVVETLAELEAIAARTHRDVLDVAARREYVVCDDGVRYTCSYETEHNKTPVLSDGGETDAEMETYQ